MWKWAFVFLFFAGLHSLAYAQRDTSERPFKTIGQGSHLRVSILICGTGNENWQTFGHSAIRIIDSTIDGPDRDLTYNYGIIGNFDGSFQDQFLKGRLRVFLDVNAFDQFMQEYIEEGRSVEELVLSLDDGRKDRMQAYLKNNALVENKYYDY